MKTPTLPFNFRISELLPLARLLRASYLRDAADFADLLPGTYTPQFLTDFDTQMANAAKVVRSSVTIAQRQLVTQRIDQLIAGLPQLLNRLEARVRRADNLTLPTKKFGIEPVRQSRHNDEHEDLTESMRTLLQNVAANKPALLAQGQKQEEINQLQELYDQLVAESTTQGSSLSDQRLLTATNVATFRALYTPMKALLADGKSLYKGVDPVKLKDYTLAQLLKMVRQQQAEDEKD